VEGDSIGLLFGQGTLPWPCSVERISDEVIDEHLLLQVLAEPVLGLMHHLMRWFSNTVI
jgi:hypothetical protein